MGHSGSAGSDKWHHAGNVISFHLDVHAFVQAKV
jgi:hypothetical protein